MDHDNEIIENESDFVSSEEMEMALDENHGAGSPTTAPNVTLNENKETKMYLLSKLTNLLPESWRGRAKSTYPAVGTLIALGIQWAESGVFDKAELTLAITGGLASLITYAVPNKETV